MRGDTHLVKRYWIRILITGTLAIALFQNCAAENFTAHGNGSPHEGIHGPDSDSSLPTTGRPVSGGPGGNPQIDNPPSNGGTNPNTQFPSTGDPNVSDHKLANIENACFQTSSDAAIAEVYFGKNANDVNRVAILDNLGNRIAKSWARTNPNTNIQSALNMDIYIIDMNLIGDYLTVNIVDGQNVYSEELVCYPMDASTLESSG